MDAQSSPVLDQRYWQGQDTAAHDALQKLRAAHTFYHHLIDVEQIKMHKLTITGDEGR